MVGRKPKPTNQKMLEGTYRKDRTINEPAFAPLRRINPPRWITDKVARKAWRKLAKMLGGNGLATVADELALGMLVSLYSKWRDAHQKAIVGVFKTKDKEYIAPNPYVGMELKYAKEVRALLSEFGLVPGSRSKIDMTKVFEDEEDEDLI